MTRRIVRSDRGLDRLADIQDKGKRLLRAASVEVEPVPDVSAPDPPAPQPSEVHFRHPANLAVWNPARLQQQRVAPDDECIARTGDQTVVVLHSDCYAGGDDSAALPGPLEVHSASSYQCVARSASATFGSVCFA